MYVCATSPHRASVLLAAMRLSAGFLLALRATSFAQLACAQATDGGGLRPAHRGGMKLTRFAEEDVLDVGVGEVHPMDTDERQVEKELVDSLEAGGQTTGEKIVADFFSWTAITSRTLDIGMARCM